MTTQKATLTIGDDRDLLVERIFNAPRSRVWRALTEPRLIAQWWGRGNPLEVEKHELVRGGHWRFVEQAPGSGPQGFEGRFREVTPESRVVQTFEWDGMPGHVIVETLELADMGDGRTRLTNTSLFHTTPERDGMLASGLEAGMNQSYAALDAVLAHM